MKVSLSNLQPSALSLVPGNVSLPIINNTVPAKQNDVESIMYNVLHDKFNNTPKLLIKQEFILVTKMRLMNLFSSKEYIPNTLQTNEVLHGLENNLIPLIDSYIEYILDMEVINNAVLDTIMYEVSNIVYSYIKLEFMKHSLVFDKYLNKNYVDEIFEYMKKRIKGEVTTRDLNLAE